MTEFDKSKLSRKAAAALAAFQGSLGPLAPGGREPNPEEWLRNFFGQEVQVASEGLKFGVSADDCGARRMAFFRQTQGREMRATPGWEQFLEAVVAQAVEAAVEARRRAFAMVEAQDAADRVGEERERASRVDALMRKFGAAS